MSEVEDHCFVHGVAEPSLPGDFRACAECWHVWRTEADYLVDVAARAAEMKWPMPKNTDTDDLPFCPLCSHDW
jgi:hypothetical protein